MEKKFRVTWNIKLYLPTNTKMKFLTKHFTDGNNSTRKFRSAIFGLHLKASCRPLERNLVTVGRICNHRHNTKL